MTPLEFKAWFDGFTEAFEGRVPTKAQWKRVQERVMEIDGMAVTHKVYVDRYWPTYWSNPGVLTTPAGPFRYGIQPCSSDAQLYNAVVSDTSSFNSLTAMNNLGRADASNIGAA
jgi:hypothetical protein